MSSTLHPTRVLLDLHTGVVNSGFTIQQAGDLGRKLAEARGHPLNATTLVVRVHVVRALKFILLLRGGQPYVRDARQPRHVQNGVLSTNNNLDLLVFLALINVVLVVICFEVVPTKVPRRELPLFLAIGSLLPDKVFIVILSFALRDSFCNICQT